MCGVFGIFGHPQGKNIAKIGVHTIQTRGGGATGAACWKRRGTKTGLIEVHKRLGTVREALQGPEYDELEGDIWITHVRYPTQGKPSRRNAQPHYTQSLYGKIVIASNGDVVNMDAQRNFLSSHSILTYTENDAELIAATINYQVTVRKREMLEAITQVMDHIKGAFSSLVMCEFDERLFAFRDPYGIRPLFVAAVDDGGKKYWMFSSETASFDATLPLFGPQAKFDYIRLVEAGEIITVGPDGLQSFQGPKAERQAFCLFEIIYFSRPDSSFFNRSFKDYRLAAGKELFQEHPIEADLISPIPKSGLSGAEGYVLASKIPYLAVIVGNPSFEIDFEGMRTFISEEEEREFKASLKYNYVADQIIGKRIGAGDDSLVRGLTTKWVNKWLWQLGARQTHNLIFSPPYRHPCFYGIATKERKKLMAADKTVEEIRQAIGAPTSLNYLSLEGLIKTTGLKKDQLCTACFDGDYPIPVNPVN